MDKRRNRISSLATSDNSGHTASFFPNFPLETTYVRKMLYDICLHPPKKENYLKRIKLSDYYANIYN